MNVLGGVNLKYWRTYEYFTETIEAARTLEGTYDDPVNFHCYWNGDLNEKHLYSILSCYYFNVLNKNNKITLWLENNTPNNINKKISKYCNIKHFSLEEEKEKIDFLKDYNFNFGTIPFYADFARILLLYNYGGCWFDLDCFFLRSFDPIFKNYKDEICVYQWGWENYPNNAIFISLKPKSFKMKNNIDFLVDRNRGWGFQQAGLTYDLPLDLLVLPASWFDGAFLNNTYFPPTSVTKFWFETSDQKYDFDNFYDGSFCYHWHNQWKREVEEDSIMDQLTKIIKNKLLSPPN